MKVFVFDLLAYGEQLEHLKVGNELPYPLARKHFKPEVAARTYAEHLDAWEELDRLGYDGVGFNEHHSSPYGLMNSPNLLAAATAQRTKNVKLLIYGNLLPLHEPLRLAEELAMLDCMSNGRLISGFARGIPREYRSTTCRSPNRAPDSKRRTTSSAAPGPRKCSPITANSGATRTSRSGRGRCSSRTRQSGCRSRQQGIDRVRRPAQHPDHPRPRLARIARRIIRYYAQCLAAAGHRSRPATSRSASAPMSPTAKPRQSGRWAPYHLYFNRTLFSHGNFTETERQRETG